MYSLDRYLAAHIFASFPFLRPLAIAPLCLRDLKRKICIKSEVAIIDRRLNCYFASVQQTILSFVSILYSVFNEHLSSTQDVKVLIYICGASQKRGLFCFIRDFLWITNSPDRGSWLLKSYLEVNRVLLKVDYKDIAYFIPLWYT